MTLKTNTADGGTDGTTVSTGNSGGASGTAWNLVNVGTSILAYESTNAPHGGMAVRFFSNGSATNTPILGWDDTANAAVTLRWYEYWTTLPSALTQCGFNIRGNAAASSLARREVDTTGQWRVVAASTSSFASTSISVSTLYRWEATATGFGGASGALTLTMYAGESLTSLASVSLSGQTTAFTVDNVRFGKFNTVGTVDLLMDSFAANVGSSTALGPISVDASPTITVISRPVVVPAPSVALGQTLTPSAITRAVVVPAPALGVGAVVLAQPVAGFVGIAPFDPTISVTMDPATITRPVVVPAPAMSTGATLNIDNLAPRATNVGSPIFDNYIVATDGDAADVAIGDSVLIYNSGGTLKENRVFTVSDLQSAFGFTNIFVAPDFAAVAASGDTLRVNNTARPAAIPDPTLSMSALIAGTAVSRPVVVPAPTVTGGALVTAVSVARAVVVPAPTTGASVTATPSAVSRAVAVPAPAVQTGSATTVGADDIIGVGAVPQPTIVVDSTVAASAIARSVVVGTPTFASTGTVAPSDVVTVAAVPAPTVKTGVTFTPASVTNPSVVIGQPTVQTDITTAPSAVARAVGIPAPTITAGGFVAAPETPLSVVVGAPTVFAQQSVTLTPAVVSAVTAAPAPAASSSTVPFPVAVSTVSAVPAVVVRASATVDLMPVAVTVDLPVAKAAAKKAGGALRGTNVRRTVARLAGGIR